MATQGRKSGEMLVYLVSCAMLLAIVLGGAFLALYVALPASDAPAWFPVAGMALVAVPWLFWGSTCLYRILSLRNAAGPPAGPGRPPPSRPPAGATSTVVSQGDVAVAPDAVDSPGGARRVRFGATIILGGSQAAPPGAQSPGDKTPSVSGDGSSHNSHESEHPLFV